MTCRRLPHGRSSLSIALLALATGCALPSLMPPLNRSYLQSGSVAGPPPSWSGSDEAPAPAPLTTPRAPVVERDSADGVTRVSIMTHQGKYFLWVQKPQITFFYVYAGDTRPADPPPVVFLVFRTQSPQSILDNKLRLACNGVPAEVGGLPTSRLEQTYQLSNHFLTFTVPRETFLEFVECRTAEVEVGGVHSPFTAQQLLDLRGFAATMATPSE